MVNISNTMNIKRFIARLTICFNFVFGSYALKLGPSYSIITVPCKDSGVWIADGLVSCQYLEKPSAFGFHKNPAGFCQQYHEECCLSCSKLQKNGYAPESYNVLFALTTSQPSSEVHSSTSQTGVTRQSPPGPCSDKGVWLLDGIISCDYLEKPSAYGIHTNPASFCQKYHKECCRTCNRIQERGFTTTSVNGIAPSKRTQSSVTIQAISPSRKTECTDHGVWIADGKVSCTYLEKPSVYGIHKNPKEFCLNHKKECCSTCLKLEQNGYMSLPNSHPSTAATTSSFQVRIQESTTKIPCTDSGVWIADGVISCIYLERPSVYGIHNNPQEFCAHHYQQCCLTCTKLTNKGYTDKPLTSSTSVKTSKEPIDSTSKIASTSLRQPTTTQKTAELATKNMSMSDKASTEEPLTSTTSTKTSSKGTINSTSQIVSTTLRHPSSTQKTTELTTKKMSLVDELIQSQNFLLMFLKKLKLPQ